MRLMRWSMTDKSPNRSGGKASLARYSTVTLLAKWRG